MATQMQLFQFNTSDVCTLTHDNGSIWFVLKDICTLLGLDVSDVVKRLDEDDLDTIHLADSLGREQKTYIVTEAGMYDVVFQSRKEEARLFQRWITHEVLPQLRQSGKYELSEIKQPKQIQDFTTRKAQVEAATDFNKMIKRDYKGNYIRFNADVTYKITGAYPREWIKKAKDAGCKSVDHSSGAQALRKLDPVLSMQVNFAKDLMANHNVTMDNTIEAAHVSKPTFKGPG